MQIKWRLRMAAAQREVWPALECTPNDLFELDTTPVVAAKPSRSKPEPQAARGRSMPPL